jgi:hypothetical protein
MPTDRNNEGPGYAIYASATMEIPNGGTVTMRGTAENSFEKAVRKLEETHALYIASGGWGGGR